MTDICTGVSAGEGFITSVVTQIDCQAELLGSGSWAALAAPGSVLSAALAGFLTIFVAFTGYNLLIGRGMTVRSGTLAAVKIGAILALATSWPAYRTLVYDVVTKGPSQLVSEIGAQTGLVGWDGTLTQQLDVADKELAQLAILSTINAASDMDAQTPPPPFGGFDAFALGGSRILFELTAVAGIGAVRIIVGLMLALGPFFVAFLMFDGTSSLFNGWVQVLAGAALATTGVSLALGLQLALLEPWLREVLARLASGEAIPTVPSELFVLIGFFALTTFAALLASARIASAFSLPALTRWATNHSDVKQPAVTIHSPPSERGGTKLFTPNRAAAVAGALVASIRRETSASVGDDQVSATSRPGFASQKDYPPQVYVPAGRVFTRSAKSRLSARATRRDTAR